MKNFDEFSDSEEQEMKQRAENDLPRNEKSRGDEREKTQAEVREKQGERKRNVEQTERTKRRV